MSPCSPSRYPRRDLLKWIAALPAVALAGPIPSMALRAAPVTEAAVVELVTGNTAFAFDLYAALRDSVEGNLLISPYSTSEALAMAYAGARGRTATQMADALSFGLDQPALHAAFADLNNDLVARDHPNADQGGDEDARRLAVANALWVEQTYPLVPAYTALLERYYGAAINQADFRNAPEAAREEVNTWVENHTEDRIQDIVPGGAIDAGTKLVLANAIYFYGSWQSAFAPADTRDEAFVRLDGTTVTVPLMYQIAALPYALGDGYQAVELEYADSGLAMTVILPDEGRFAEVEADLDAARLETVVGQLGETEVHVYLPKLEFTSPTIRLNDALMNLGIVDAFDGRRADFAGIASAGLYITSVLHKAFIGFDERGTEVAAATVVIFGSPIAMAPLEVRVDRPFLFAIRDTVTGTVLFLGRVLDPTA